MKSIIYFRDEIIKYNYLDYLDINKNMSDRNKEIVVKFTMGYSGSELAKMFNVSYNRIQKIVYAFVSDVRAYIKENNLPVYTKKKPKEKRE